MMNFNESFSNKDLIYETPIIGRYKDVGFVPLDQYCSVVVGMVVHPTHGEDGGAIPFTR